MFGPCTMAVFFNFCLYQLGWFACIFGAANGQPWLGMGLALGLVGVHLWLSGETRRQLALIGAAGVIGLTIDTLQLWCGVFRFPGGTIAPWLAPLWVGVLWMQFATILPFSLHWLSNRYWLSAVLGLVGGPLAYYAGEKVGAVVFLAPRLPHFAVLGVFWSVALPAIIWVSDRLDLVASLGSRYRFQGGRVVMTHPHRVVIIGGGFAGLSAAIGLRRAAVDVTLVDRRNFHLFQPLLYQVATGGLSPANISAPLRSVLKRQKNTRVLLAEACDFDLANRRVILGDGMLDYDTLVVATGASHHYFGNDHWEMLAPGLKTIEDATEIRRRIFLAFEAAERTGSPEGVQELLTFVVVGGGPTGVELAGALAEIARDTLTHEFRSIDPAAARILLLEGTDRILPFYPGSLPDKAQKQLEQLGVTVRTGTLVSDIAADHVTVRAGEQTERIPTRTVLWAAGVKASNLSRRVASLAGIETDRVGRIPVEADLTIAGYPEVFAIGDLASLACGPGRTLPGVAPVAIQQGQHVARTIRNRLQNKPTRPFRYRDFGTMATIGRHRAVAVCGPLRFSGYVAWFAWLFVHLMNLVEFRDRVFVLMEWAWSYVTWNRGARLITGTEHLPAGFARIGTPEEAHPPQGGSSRSLTNQRQSACQEVEK